MIRLEPHNAQLLLQIYELRREEKLRRAREWFLKSFVADTSAEFAALCPVGSENNAFFRMVATYWDMVASIVNRGMLDEDFYFENTTESLLVWLRMRNVVQEMRVTRKNPLYLRNIELLADKHEKWLSARAPGALEVIHANIAALRKK
ncbi:MAG: hypothetical protein A3F68_03485 [Acidobacteria bacterium RIFCSPLOWO2_12_FULL_54_10]|nr:MAG: hypothetical protein A3F68_03485 [Acidobacteria bacterium RIFCSPLOWO2_12_FULL_54_10]